LILLFNITKIVPYNYIEFLCTLYINLPEHQEIISNCNDIFKNKYQKTFISSTKKFNSTFKF